MTDKMLTITVTSPFPSRLQHQNGAYN